MVMGFLLVRFVPASWSHTVSVRFVSRNDSIVYSHKNGVSKDEGYSS